MEEQKLAAEAQKKQEEEEKKADPDAENMCKEHNRKLEIIDI